MASSFGLKMRPVRAPSVHARSRTLPPVRPDLRRRVNVEERVEMELPDIAPKEAEPQETLSKAVDKFWGVVVGTLAALAQRTLNAFSESVPMPLFTKVTVVFVRKAIEAALLKKKDLEGTNRAVADLSPYLFPTHVDEVKHIRKMSALTALSYKPWLVTRTSLKRRLKMDLVSSSWAIKTEAEKARFANEVKGDTKGPFSVVSNLLSGSTSSLTTVDDYLNFTFLEWFSVDEPSTDTRYFVVMGSDTIDHWRLNLTVDPVPFEDPALGVKIHSGVYEAAEALYARFKPSVLAYLETNPFGKICFVGHSIGGSMATALMLMFKMRGVLREENIADVYTFGVPSLFLEGEDCFNRIISDKASSEASGAVHDQGSSCAFHTHCELCGSGPRGLLQAVGLPESIIRNVLMAYDFVPRAFTSDYESIAEILQKFGPGLLSHSSLASSREGRSHLYFYVGKVLVMQASSDLKFVGSDSPHPMLPPETAVYYIESPNPSVKYRPPHTPISKQTVTLPGTTFVPSSSAEAVSELMDNPHPLEMFSRPAYIYGANGGISRYHNPEHYTRAFARVVHHMKQQTVANPVAGVQ